MKQIPLIEGLRGYLALWVVFDHLLAMCGYGLSDLNTFLKIIRSGWYAVDVFIIISGFVIFYLLDAKRETYKVFITRRFFRLWPLFIVLFIVSIPLSKLYLWNVNEFMFLHPSATIGDGLVTDRILSWWDNILPHILFHFFLLHGMLPDSILPYSPGAFLGPAWSISLEWQFYLIAPVIFYTSEKLRIKGFLIFTLFTVLFILWGSNITSIQFGAFLPMHMEYFYMGIISYYIFKFLVVKGFLAKIKLLYVALPIVIIVLLIDFKFGYIPFLIWLFFFSLLIDYTRSENKNVFYILGFIFENKFTKWLGAISYSMYLSHFLVLTIVQNLILNFLPEFSRKNHFMVLTFFVIIFTIIVSQILYKNIEMPFVKKGNYFSKNIIEPFGGNMKS